MIFKSRKVLLFTVFAVLVAVSGAFLFACTPDWRTAFDLERPVGGGVYASREEAIKAGGGWYTVMNEEFDYSDISEFLYDPVKNPESVWTNSPDGVRKDADVAANRNLWQREMLFLKDGILEVHAEQRADGRVTSGIETRLGSTSDGSADGDVELFKQAFGYFECRVKVPTSSGMWSAFWLQSMTQGKIGDAGRDGTEMDVYESAFLTAAKEGRFLSGQALLWDGYAEHLRIEGNIATLDHDLYDGEYHTYSLKWTPTSYVFYVDGAPVWASDGGGVSQVPQFLRLTTEIDTGDEIGPHGENIGKFDTSVGDSTFYIDRVTVLQHTGYDGR